MKKLELKVRPKDFVTKGKTLKKERSTCPTSHQCGNQVANRVSYAQLMVQGLVQSNEQTIEYGAVL